ncbi:restriction endonuclease subunit S [Pedobacter sp. N23S346]|uniref:restriction endonuclease subunit S n=1 Tax=Pedobacter sp. N23S346 TaxID=3402750 RepID=UPI003AC29636
MVKENTMKQTEIGLIPDNWDIKTIEEVITEISMGPFGSDIKVSNFVDKGVPVLNGYNVSCIKLKSRHSNFVSNEKAKDLKKAVAKRGDIVVTHRGTIGQIAYIPQDSEYKEYVISQSQFRFTLNKKRVIPEFLVYFFHSNKGQNIITETKGHTGVPAIAQATTTFKKISIPLPPLPEQEAIAEALSDADAWIENLEQLIAKKRLIKHGAMQELLSPKEDWEVKKLGEVTIDGGLIRGPFGGALKKEFFVKNGYKVYEQKNAIYKSVHLGKYFVDTAKFKELGRFEIKANDFILSCSGTIGKLFRIPQIFQKGIINQALLIIRLNSTIIDFGYFGHIFQYDTIQSKIIDDTQGGAMKNLVGMSEFRNTEIPLPALPEQTRIARILSDMDAELEALEGQLGKARKVKQGMMQELLTGKTRLI